MKLGISFILEVLALEQSKGYKTKQSEIIINYLKNRKSLHVTADEIIEDLKNQGISIGKSTVYRQIDKLVKDGAVQKYFFEEGTSACYQYIDNSEGCREHFHFKCIKCGRLFHVDCDYLQSADEHILKEHKFKVDNTKTVFYGICDKCS